MARTAGSADIMIGLIDGPVATNHGGLAANIRPIGEGENAACTGANDTACLHGTFVAGILCAKPGGSAPAICPDCTLLVREVFAHGSTRGMHVPTATPRALAAAIVECVKAGARVLNLSLALTEATSRSERELSAALEYAAGRNVVIVAAAGNQGTIGSSAITRHPWVIPVVSYDLRGTPMGHSNLGVSIGRRGLGAPGANVTSLDAAGESLTLTGTSVAAPFVTGAVALLWSAFPMATSAQIRFSITQARATRRTSVVPPLLNAWEAFQFMHSGKLNG
jgi:subtilisin family serine protease